jgi:hypothetical protein
MQNARGEAQGISAGEGEWRSPGKKCRGEGKKWKSPEENQI